MIIETSTVEELKEYAQLWADGKLDHLYLEGTPGSGKTHTFREVTDDVKHAQWIGDSSPFAFYKKLYKHRTAPLIILDDVDRLLRAANGLQLLKVAMGSPDNKRTLHWNSNRTGTDKAVPASFELTPRVAIITNDFGSRNTHTEAVRSRSTVLRHAPGAHETLEYAKEEGLITEDMFERIDQDLYPPPDYLNLRTLLTCKKLDEAGKPWFEILENNT